MRKTEDVIKDSKKYLLEESIKVGRFINPKSKILRLETSKSYLETR